MLLEREILENRLDDDVDVLEALDAWEPANRPTVVVLTASHDESLREECNKHQVHDFINKPVHEKEFMRVVRDHKKLMIHSTPMLATV